jgi:hypothetical protein
MPETVHRRPFPQRILRAAVLLALSLSVLSAVIGTIHWPIVGDAPVLHYTTFLLDHGKAPYTQIIEMDLPGTYAIEWTARHTFGDGPLAWRMADFLLVAVIWLSMVLISAQTDWLAGFWAGALFVLIHFRDGPTHTGQRDLMMTAMLLPGCVSLLFAARKNRPWLYTLFGLFLGAATTIKPSGLFFAAAFAALLWMHLHQLQRPKAGPFLDATLGFLIPVLLTAGWLQHYGAVGAFFSTMRGLSAYHASLGRPSFAALIVGSFPSVLLAVAIPVLPVFIARKPWRHWQGQVVLAGVILGCVSYVVQGKGFPYHRYPTESLLLLLIGILAFRALHSTTWTRYAAVATILLGALFLAPVSASIANRFDWRDQEFNRSLASDLNKLGGQALQNQVQCFDNTAGCTNTLYNLQLVQATGYLYDCYSFQAKQSAYQDRYREDFLAAVERADPRVVVVSDQDCFTMNRGFARLDRWPQFEAYIAGNYTLAKQYTPPHTVGWWRHPAQPFSYRIYLRKSMFHVEH